MVTFDFLLKSKNKGSVFAAVVQMVGFFPHYFTKY